MVPVVGIGVKWCSCTAGRASAVYSLVLGTIDNRATAVVLDLPRIAHTHTCSTIDSKSHLEFLLRTLAVLLGEVCSKNQSICSNSAILLAG